MVCSDVFQIHVFILHVCIDIHTCLSDAGVKNSQTANIAAFGSGLHNRKSNCTVGKLQQGDNNPTTNRT